MLSHILYVLKYSDSRQMSSSCVLLTLSYLCMQDSGKNMVAMLKGRKRYILNPPAMCRKLGIEVNHKHPIFRHSLVDWSDINEAKRHSFDKVEAVETIVNAGEVLYIPSHWFHYIVSLEYNIQCNSRSGVSSKSKSIIQKCLQQGRSFAGDGIKTPSDSIK